MAENGKNGNGNGHTWVWRVFTIGTIIIANVMSAVYFYGSLERQVSTNTIRIDRLEGTAVQRDSFNELKEDVKEIKRDLKEFNKQRR